MLWAPTLPLSVHPEGSQRIRRWREANNKELRNKAGDTFTDQTAGPALFF